MNLTWLQCQIPRDEWEALNERRKALGLKWVDIIIPGAKAELSKLEAAAPPPVPPAKPGAKKVKVTKPPAPKATKKTPPKVAKRAKRKTAQELGIAPAASAEEIKLTSDTPVTEETAKDAEHIA